MSEKNLIQHCAPTLAGLKTGSLFSCAFTSKKELQDDLRAFNRRLSKKGLRLLPVQYKGKRALIYVYRPKHLARDLNRSEAQQILRARGYPSSHPSGCLVTLVEKLRTEAEFPHEIGLFLGYPPEDVSGFIENRPEIKCVGAWKVYGDAHAAQQLFRKYKKCTGVYTRHWESGKSIERLTVNV